MKKCGYDDKLKYKNSQKKTKTKPKHKRNITWYNPTFSNSMKTNIVRKFINLVKIHFNKHNPLTKWHNMQTSYSCTDNLERIIKAHNKKVLNKNKNN